MASGNAHVCAQTQTSWFLNTRDVLVWRAMAIAQVERSQWVARSSVSAQICAQKVVTSATPPTQVAPSQKLVVLTKT
jgi:hypothetical protein